MIEPSSKNVYKDKSKTEAKRSQSKDEGIMHSSPFAPAQEEVEAQDVPQLKHDYKNNAKAYLNIIDDLKQTLNNDAEMDHRYNTYSNRDSLVNPTRNSKE